ncbi:DUF1223 domain-containing protein [Dokdonella soli]|uniref:DUF1223 domain-containing protein n=1 Tax=Dokdonella soli TaxID=529810 RepID=A0ABN1IDD5_9GAMM
MRILFTCLIFTLAAIGIAHADCSVTSGATRARLVELYTSEGCSSCPPADHWLSALPAGTGLVPLAFHVDYWDSPGWTDRFADPRFTQRQRALAAQSNGGIVYTPEVAVDGREWRNWSSGRPPATGVAQPLGLALHVDPGQPLHVRLDTTVADGVASAYVAYFALSEDQLTSAVRGGENRGVELHEDHVVRAFVGPLKLTQAQAAIAMPAGVRVEHAAVAAFVQRVDDGEVANVVQLPLDRCVGKD